MTAICGSFGHMNFSDLDKEKLYLGVFVKVNLDYGWVYASESFFKSLALDELRFSKPPLQRVET